MLFERSPAFQAPETRMCSGKADGSYDPIKADVWSLACILFSLLESRVRTEWRTGGEGPLPFGCAEDFGIQSYAALLGDIDGPDMRSANKKTNKKRQRILDLKLYRLLRV